MHKIISNWGHIGQAGPDRSDNLRTLSLHHHLENCVIFGLAFIKDALSIKAYKIDR